MLLEEYVATFEKFDDLTMNVEGAAASPLIVGKAGYSWYKWKPVKMQTPPEALTQLYERLPGRLPPLYERLISNFRWAQVEAGSHCLLANLPGEDFSDLLEHIQGDRGLWEGLAPAGFIQFARAPGGSYDPVCFDLRHRKQNAECRVVQIDHEGILIRFRIREVRELAPTFRALVMQTIESAKTLPSRTDVVR